MLLLLFFPRRFVSRNCRQKILATRHHTVCCSRRVLIHLHIISSFFKGIKRIQQRRNPTVSSPRDVLAVPTCWPNVFFIVVIVLVPEARVFPWSKKGRVVPSV